MNENKPYYARLKRYWKLQLKDHEILDYKTFRKYTGFYHLITEQQLVDELLRPFKELEEFYWLIQNLRSSIKHKNTVQFQDIISQCYKHIATVIQTSLKKLK